MSQRDSGYARKERDLYETPVWVTQTLLPHIPISMVVWEPACASGKMVRALQDGGHSVTGTDIEMGDEANFLHIKGTGAAAIITNPPYELAREFIEHALVLLQRGGLVAMLLRTDFDHAKTRSHLFAGCSSFSKKIVLTKRIKWFEDSKGQPSFNHAWFIWNSGHQGPPTLAYEPTGDAA